jgi:hypothetical protein
MIKGPVAVSFGCIMASGCAPSHRMVHDGNLYFEHCYAADFDAHVTPADREACWNAWLAHYTRHQAAHRIDYAMRRVEAIQTGEQTLSLPGLPGGQADAPTDPKAAALIRPGATEVGQALSATLQPDGDAGEVPQGCSEACRGFEDQCAARCPPAAGACKPLCARERAICLEGCY